MATEDPREEVIQKIADMLRHNSFTFEFKVMKRPKGIKVIYEVTKEEMDAMVNEGLEKEKKKSENTES